MPDFFDDYIPEPEIFEEIWPLDDYQKQAEVDIRNLYEADNSDVYFARQLGEKFEKKYLHWITVRAVKYLSDIGYLKLVLRLINKLSYSSGDIRRYLMKNNYETSH
jgi:hypothetical protein